MYANRTLRVLVNFFITLIGFSLNIADSRSAKNAQLWNNPMFGAGFVANHGQMDPDVLFFARLSSGVTLYFTSSKLLMAGSDEEIEPFVGTMNWSTSSRNISVFGEDQLASYTNFLIGDDPGRWRTNVRHYASVRYKGIHDGIDLVFYYKNGSIQFDFEVSPGIDPAKITFGFEKSLFQIDSEGDLIVLIGSSEVRFKKPFTYQRLQRSIQMVTSEFVVRKSGRLSFKFGEYDSTSPLIIDPVVVFSTYHGGKSDDRANAITVDDNGNSYITGFTKSRTFRTKGPFQSRRKGTQDVFVSKIDTDGRLIYSTFLGGAGNQDAGHAIAVNSLGEAVIVGQTSSRNFPTRSALQRELRGSLNGFVSKLSPNGKRLIFSTYLGGSSADVANGVALAPSGDVFVTGTTDSSDFPVINSLQPSIGGLADAFLCKLTSDGKTLVYSTYLGGTMDDSSNAVSVDDSGQAHITGSTDSRNFPLRNPLQSRLKGFSDAFLTKVNSAGSRLLFSTFIGGDGPGFGGGQDVARDIAIDSTGSIWLTGFTTSPKFPLVKPFAMTKGGTVDAFVAKVSRTGKRLLFSTYLGGEASDDGFSLSVDPEDNIYITGRTHSSDFPLVNPLQSFNGGQSVGDDAFITVINGTASIILFSTFFGGKTGEFGTGIEVSNRVIYLCGFTSSDDFPVTKPFQSSKKGDVFSNDAFIANIELSP